MPLAANLFVDTLGHAFLAGLAAAIFVAFAPQWLATWSDQRDLPRP